MEYWYIVGTQFNEYSQISTEVTGLHCYNIC